MGFHALSPARRRGALILAILVTTFVLLQWRDSSDDGLECTRRASVSALRDLAAIGNPPVEGDAPEPIAVTVVQEGGPAGVAQAVERALDDVDGLTVAPSRHLLRVEVVGDRLAAAATFRLWRRGWDLRSVQPVWIFVAPWLAWGAALFGAVVSWWRSTLTWGIVTAAAVVQIGSVLAPWPAGGIGPPSWWTWVLASPMVQVVHAQAWRDVVGLAILVVVVTLVAGLTWRHATRGVHRPRQLATSPNAGVAGSHDDDGLRKSTNRKAWAAVMLACLSVLAWSEAAGRVCGYAFTGSAGGIASMSVVGLAWLFVWRAIESDDG